MATPGHGLNVCGCPPSPLQAEVEGYFIDKGVILPTYHKVYFMGLTTPQWPKFKWLDPGVPQLSAPGTSVSCGMLPLSALGMLAPGSSSDLAYCSTGQGGNVGGCLTSSGVHAVTFAGRHAQARTRTGQGASPTICLHPSSVAVATCFALFRARPSGATRIAAAATSTSARQCVSINATAVQTPALQAHSTPRQRQLGN